MLKELQKDFARSITGAEDKNIVPLIKHGKIPAENLIDIYRNNSFAAITQALRLTYPVAEKLVGEVFFQYAAHEFIKNNWPKNGDMDDYGGNFSIFLKDFPAAQNLPYLSDVARFEWLYQKSALAENSAALGPEDFAGLKPEDYQSIGLNFHPVAQLFSSPYPIEKIWRANIERLEENIDLDAGDCRILMLRPETTVMLYSVSGPEYIWLEKLAGGASLYDAYEAASNKDSEFALDICLQRHILSGTFAAFHK